MWRLLAPGNRLTMSSLTLVATTGSNVIVVGWFEVVAQVTLALLIGAQSVPFQALTVTETGRPRLEFVAK